MKIRYSIELTPDSVSKDTIMGTCPALPEVTVYGDSPKDVLMHIADAVLTATEAQLSAGIKARQGTVLKNKLHAQVSVRVKISKRFVKRISRNWKHNPATGQWVYVPKVKDSKKS